jgi:hypothetical protein
MVFAYRGAIRFERIKIGFEHLAFPPVRAPYFPDIKIHVTQFMKTPMDKDKAFICDTIASDVTQDILDAGGDVSVLDCLGTHSNFTSSVILLVR